MSLLLPSMFKTLVKQGKVLGPIAADTETSGLHVDDGARIATVSIAWPVVKGYTSEYSNLTVEYHADIDRTIASIAWPFDQGVAGTGKAEDNGQTTLWADADNLPRKEYEALLWVLARRFLVMHNAKFDCHQFWAGVRRWPGLGRDLSEQVIWDTQNGNAQLYPLLRNPKDKQVTTSLKPSCANLFNEEVQDEQSKVKEYLRKKKLPSGRWDLMPWDIIGPYADLDARLTLRLYFRQLQDIESGSREGNYMTGPVVVADDAQKMLERRLAITRLLFKMERRGLPYDAALSRDTAAACLLRAKSLGESLPFRPTGDAAKQYFFTEEINDRGNRGLNLIPYSTTELGAPQLTEEIVTRMVADRIEYAQSWADYRKVTNAASMWYNGYADSIGPDNRLRTSFRQNGTRSTRFSVERVNLQAIPQDYRLTGYDILSGLPTPRGIIGAAVKEFYPGYHLYELDLAQAELRVAAWLADCTTMLRMINEGADLHTYTTKELFDMGPDHPEFGKYRQVGKRGNFSLIFGSGPATFKGMVSKETGILLEDHEASRIVREWNALYPEFSDAIDKHMLRVERRQVRHGYGWIDLLNGERRYFQRHEDVHKAFNQRVQPNLAQFGISWMLKSEAILQSAGIGLPGAGDGMLLVVHDSQVILVPATEEGKQVVEACRQAGKDLWHNWFPVPGDVDVKLWSH